MASGKKSEHSGVPKARRELEDLEVVFGALANASRRHVLLVLHLRGGELSAGDIAARFRCSWPTTTRHLGVLRAAGLVEVEQHGRQRIYRLNRERLAGIAGGWLGRFETKSDVPVRVQEKPGACLKSKAARGLAGR